MKKILKLACLLVGILLMFACSEEENLSDPVHAVVGRWQIDRGYNGYIDMVLNKKGQAKFIYIYPRNEVKDFETTYKIVEDKIIFAEYWTSNGSSGEERVFTLDCRLKTTLYFYDADKSITHQWNYKSADLRFDHL